MANNDFGQAEPARFAASAFANNGSPFYLYRFSYVQTAMRGLFNAGTPHGGEIGFVFGTLGIGGFGPPPPPPTAEDQAVSRMEPGHYPVLNHPDVVAVVVRVCKTHHAMQPIRPDALLSRNRDSILIRQTIAVYHPPAHPPGAIPMPTRLLALSLLLLLPAVVAWPRRRSSSTTASSSSWSPASRTSSRRPALTVDEQRPGLGDREPHAPARSPSTRAIPSDRIRSSPTSTRRPGPRRSPPSPTASRTR